MRRDHLNRLCPRDIRPPECWDCPVDISPMDILAQRQDFWIAHPTLKALNQKQSLAAVHHDALCSLSGSCSIASASHVTMRPDWRGRKGAQDLRTGLDHPGLRQKLPGPATC